MLHLVKNAIKNRLSNISAKILNLTPNGEPALLKQYPARVIKATKVQNVHDFLTFNGYPAETHTIPTEDDYILRLQRIPNYKGHPILLMHGMHATAFNWVMMGPDSDLPFLLHSYGYDVWLGNARSSRFSRCHKKLNPNKDKEFWNFSFHEIGTIDIPTIIDYILQKTDCDKMSYVGHSQGCTAFFTCMSVKPEYNKYITLMHALTPAVYLKHMRSPMIKLGAGFFQLHEYPFAEELNIQSDIYRQTVLSSKFMLNTALNLAAKIVGEDIRNFNMERLPVIVYNFPNSCSVRQLAHFYQIYKTGIFAPFDENFWLYGKATATAYDLSKITAPVALYYCKNDYLIGVKDVQRLASELPNVVEDFLIPREDWNHMAPLIALDVRHTLYSYMMKLQDLHLKCLFEVKQNVQLAIKD